MRILGLLFVCSLAAACTVFKTTVVTESFDGDRAYALVAEQMDFGPRIPGTSGHRSVGRWIETQLSEQNWRVEVQRMSYQGTELRTIIGTPNWETSGEPLLLGAHYDTRPHADRDPSNPAEPVPGANDGASGTAVLLELARVLGDQRFQRTVWLVFFDGEDSGQIADWDWIVGSRYYADHLVEKPEAVVVVDMVGDRDLQIYMERNSSPDLSVEIWAVAAELGWTGFIPEWNHAIIDDHIPFQQLGIPSVLLIDFDYPYWHTTEDTLDKVSAESLEQVGSTLQSWLELQ